MESWYYKKHFFNLPKFFQFSHPSKKPDADEKAQKFEREKRICDGIDKKFPRFSVSKKSNYAQLFLLYCQNAQPTVTLKRGFCVGGTIGRKIFLDISKPNQLKVLALTNKDCFGP